MFRPLHETRANRKLTCLDTAQGQHVFAGGHRDAGNGTSKNDDRRETMLRRARQKGVATIEFAFVAPIVFLIVLALFQFVSLLMSQNVLSAAAREGGRFASLPQTTSEDAVVVEVEERLRRGGINPNLVDVDVNPQALGNLNTGDAVSVLVTCQMYKLVWIGPFLPSNLSLSAQFACERE